jgi:uncharacterized protein
MKARQYESVEIDQCPTCHGVWLDDGEIARIIESEEEAFDHALVVQAVEAAFAGIPTHEVESKEACPHCQSQLLAINFAYNSGVIVDRCPKGHGIWFDGKELDQLQARHEHWSAQIEKDKSAWKKTLSDVEAKTKVDFEKLKQEAQLPPSRFLLFRVIQKLMNVLD